MEFFNCRTVKSAKTEHTCHICKGIINIGDSYVKESGKYRGEFFDRASHIVCHHYLRSMLDASGETEYSEDEVSEYIHETICAFCDKHEDCSLICFDCEQVVKLAELGDKGGSYE